jgi:hypothetical protein
MDAWGVATVVGVAGVATLGLFFGILQPLWRGIQREGKVIATTRVLVCAAGLTLLTGAVILITDTELRVMLASNMLIGVIASILVSGVLAVIYMIILIGLSLRRGPHSERGISRIVRRIVIKQKT